MHTIGSITQLSVNPVPVDEKERRIISLERKLDLALIQLDQIQKILLHVFSIQEPSSEQQEES